MGSTLFKGRVRDHSENNEVTYHFVLRSLVSKGWMGRARPVRCAHFPPQLRCLGVDAKVDLHFDRCPHLPSLWWHWVHSHQETRGLTHPVPQGGRSSRWVLRQDWIRSLQGPGRHPYKGRLRSGTRFLHLGSLPTGSRPFLVLVSLASFQAVLDILLKGGKTLLKAHFDA